MKQIFTDSLIGTHSEREFALRPRKTTRSLDVRCLSVSNLSKLQAAGRFESALGAGGAVIICNSRDRLWAIIAQRVNI